MRTFILGLGAQKSGTTWLYNQILKSEKFKQPALKEMHLFDLLYAEECASLRSIFEKKFSESLLKGSEHYSKDFSTRKFHMFLDTEEYFRYFDELMDEDGCLSSDITPSYCGLSVETLEYIRSRFESRSIQVRVIYLMREPIRRIDSALKMKLRDNGTLKMQATPEELFKKLNKMSEGKFNKMQSSYRATTEKILKCFDRENVYFGFYETMFQAPEVKRLASFVGMDADRFNTKAKFNYTNRLFKYPKEALLNLRSKYEDNYRLASEDMKFPIEMWDQAFQEICEAD